MVIRMAPSEDKLFNFKYQKLLRYEHHKLNYMESIKRNITPSGLKIKKTAAIQSASPEFKDQWDAILNDAESKLIKLLLQETSVIEKQLNEEINSDISTFFPKDNFELHKNKIINNNKSYSQTLRKRRERKWEKFENRNVKKNIRSTKIVKTTSNKLTSEEKFNTKRTSKQKTYAEVLKSTTKRKSGETFTDKDQSLLDTLLSLPEDEEIIVSNIPDTNDTEYDMSCEPISENVLRQDERDTREERLKGRFISETVFNLSKKVLTEIEVQVLEKGLDFAPVQASINETQLRNDFGEFCRRMRLKWHFRNEPSENFSETPAFKPKSTWKPPNGHACLEVFLSQVEKELLSASKGPFVGGNFSKEEWEAVRSLAADRSIVIKKADKGSGIVIWDREDYCKEAENHLGDDMVYKEIKFKDEMLSSLVERSNKMFRDLESRKLISEKEMRYFLFDFKNASNLGKMYFLPKIHKRLDNVPGRPVISNCGTPTERVSEFLDHHLKPVMQSGKSYIKDSGDFLNKIKRLGKIPEGAFLVSVDVVGLYPSIPHLEGLEALRKRLEKRVHAEIPTDKLVDMAKFVLENNIFEFDSRTFQQLAGTAIGTKFAPPYACIFMDELEEEFLEGEMVKPLIWLRYIDDIFFIWTGSEEELFAFLGRLNSFSPGIKFTHEISIAGDRVNLRNIKFKNNRSPWPLRSCV